MIREFFKSKLFLFLGTLALLLLGLSLGREMYKKYQIDKEVTAMQAEIKNLQTSDKDLLSLIDYFKTPEYKERQARSLLNLQKPGEFVVALPQTQENQGDESEGSGTRPGESNLEKWWNYFFSQKNEKS